MSNQKGKKNKKLGCGIYRKVRKGFRNERKAQLGFFTQRAWLPLKF